MKLWTGNDAAAETVSNSLSYSVQTQFFFPSMNRNTTMLEPGQQPHDNLPFYLGIYVALSALSALVGVLRYFWIFCGSIRASRKLFDALSYCVLRTPLRWMDTVPLGRILNRFTADFNIIDSRISNDLASGASNLFRVIGVVVAG